MTLLLLFGIALYGLVATVHVVRLRNRARRNDLVLAAETPYTWAALVLAAAIPLSTYDLLRSPLLRYPGILAPLLALGLVSLVRDIAKELSDQFDWQLDARFASRVLLLGLAALAGVILWTYWPRSSPYHHPLLIKAERRSQRIQSSRQALEVTLASMHRTLDEFERPVRDEEVSLKHIKMEAVELVQLADTLAEHYRALVVYHERFLIEVKDAPDLFQKAAIVWRGYAEEERDIGYQEIAERYMEVADLFDAYAGAIQTEEDEPLSIQEVHEVMRFVARGRLMLARLAENTPPVTAAEILDRKAQLENSIQFFVMRFDTLRTEIQTLTKRLHRTKDTPKEHARFQRNTSAVSQPQLPQVQPAGYQPGAKQPPRLVRELISGNRG